MHGITLNSIGIKRKTAVDVQATMTIQATTEDDIIYSIVSDDSFGSGNSACMDAQQALALPYETAIFHNHGKAVDTQKSQQDISDSKLASKSDEIDSKHNQQHRKKSA